MVVLGVETSCDECSIAVGKDGEWIFRSIIATQSERHRPYMGVGPEIASRIHTEWIAGVAEQALQKADLSPGDIDAVAVTNRPGLSGALLVGLNFAKAFAFARGIPFIGVDHIKAHLYAPHILQEIPYPYLGLLVSGGHTVICSVTGFDEIEVLGTTIDDAIGEAFDKVAAYHGMGYPGGAVIDRLARTGNPYAFNFPEPSLHKGEHDFDVSYSGLKTAVINQLDQFWDGTSQKSFENIAASFQRTAVSLLMVRVIRALARTGYSRIVTGGGVAANSELRKRLAELTTCEAFIPPMELCTDNGAMIAGVGYQYLVRGERSPLGLQVNSRVQAFRHTYP